MELTPYLESLRRDLTAAAAPGGPEVARAAELLSDSLEAGARLVLLEALSDAAAEITTRLTDASVEIRLRGRDADVVVTETATAPPVPPPSLMATETDVGDISRITLRLPEPLKQAVERTAQAEGISVNAWLVRTVSAAVHGSQPLFPTSHAHYGRRVTGFAQA
jgi:hypothetical protein